MPNYYSDLKITNIIIVKEVAYKSTFSNK